MDGNGPITDHPHTDPGDGRQECYLCGKWVWPFLHSCKGVPATPAADERFLADREGYLERLRTRRCW